MSFTEYLENLIDLKLSDVQTGMIGKIEKFDSTRMRADVKPLLKIENALEEELDLPILIDLPVLFHSGDGYFIKPNYAAGNLVWLGFMTHDMEDALNEYTKPASKKMFELHNACVLGGIVKNNASLPDSMSNEGLVIGHENGTYINIKSDSVKIVDSSNNSFELKNGKINMLGASEAFLNGTTFDSWLTSTLITIFNAHTHAGVLSGGASTAVPTPLLTPPSGHLSTKIKGE